MVASRGPLFPFDDVGDDSDDVADDDGDDGGKEEDGSLSRSSLSL